MAKPNIKINRKGTESITEQVSRQLTEQITSGKLPPGEPLPSERALAEQLGVSRDVLRTAYRRLVDQGLVETERGVGRRVAGGSTSPAAKATTKSTTAKTASKSSTKTAAKKGSAAQKSTTAKAGATPKKASGAAKKTSTK